jgi:hypothetical protein
VVWAASFLLIGLCGATPAADDLTLTKDCEAGFRRFIRMAQTGQLGDDVTNANVGVEGNQVRVELVRAGAPAQLFSLAPKRSPRAASRYFEVVAGAGATASDADRVGRALDQIFAEDPFHIVALEQPPGNPIPTLAEAWALSGWRGVVRGLERRMMVLASLPYTIGVIVSLAAGVLASLVLLWVSPVPARGAGKPLAPDRDA